MGQSVAEWECRDCGWFTDEDEGTIFINNDSGGYQYLCCAECYTPLSPGLATINRVRVRGQYVALAEEAITGGGR